MHQYQSSSQSTRTTDIKELRAAILGKLTYAAGKDVSSASDLDWFVATALAARDQIIDGWLDSTRRAEAGQGKRVYYLSIEYLIGRVLFDALTNLGLMEPAREALASFGVDLDRLRTLEPDAGLGNGGLGRLAACFMDSMASLGLPAYGYGIRYQQGLFKQEIRDGWQHELPDDWLAYGNPWEFARPEVSYPVGFGGTVEYVGGSADTARGIWYPAETVLATAYDTPIVGWRRRHVNTLRLWSARATDAVQLKPFNPAEVVDLVAARAQAEAICRVLYPSTATLAGEELRLRQEYFFTSASLQDILRRHLAQYETLASLPDKAAIQLNDTHPAIAVAELMRILVDEHDFPWPDAWSITTRTLNYTNHTLMPEALESWPASLLNRLLPRHLQIIYLINWFHLGGLAERGMTDRAMISSVSLIDESADKRVRMGHLAFVGAHKVNGVSALHTELMRRTIFRGLDADNPGKIVNKTNGISFRRWLHQANPGLTSLLTEVLGKRVCDDTDALRELERHAGASGAGASGLVGRFAETRLRNKMALAQRVRTSTGIAVDPSALFDVHIKRIHEYKRQLLNILETIALFQAIRARPSEDWTSRVKIFAGKAASDYTRAKLIIKLAHDVGRTVNSDPIVGHRLKLAFLPDYNVSLAEQIIPAADLSEQISTAGMEASGTGNMKLALNGALTIGTLDGANIEMREQVGAENFFIFGLTASEVEEDAARDRPGARPRRSARGSRPSSKALRRGRSRPRRPIDFATWSTRCWTSTRSWSRPTSTPTGPLNAPSTTCGSSPNAWWRASITTTARMGWFSSDRTIHEYADEIWNVAS